MLATKLNNIGSTLQWSGFRGAIQIRNVITKSKSENEANDENEDKIVPPSFADDQDVETEVKINTDMSRLLPQHLRILNNQKPYDTPQSWIHLTEKYQRKIYGRYGSASGVDPRICFPTAKDIEEQREYEKVAYPYTLAEMIEKNKQEKAARLAKIMKREEDVEKKMAKLEQWKKDLQTKLAKKEKDAMEAKQRKERIVEEVRRHFGFKIDPRDDRFKEMLEQKEKEDKKKQKEEKRKAKESKMMAKLVNMTGNKETEAANKEAEASEKNEPDPKQN